MQGQAEGHAGLNGHGKDGHVTPPSDTAAAPTRKPARRRTEPVVVDGSTGAADEIGEC